MERISNKSSSTNYINDVWEVIYQDPNKSFFGIFATLLSPALPNLMTIQYSLNTAIKYDVESDLLTYYRTQSIDQST